MKTPHELKQLFYEKQFIGHVLRCSTLLESELDILLCQFFCQKRRAEFAADNLLSTLNWNQKIELLSKLPNRKNTKSYNHAIAGLRSFKRLRNLVAHQWTVSKVEIEKLCRSKEISKMLDGYPEEMDKAFHICRNALGRLRRTREFVFEDKTFLEGHFMLSKIFD